MWAGVEVGAGGKVHAADASSCIAVCIVYSNSFDCKQTASLNCVSDTLLSLIDQHKHALPRKP